MKPMTDEEYLKFGSTTQRIPPDAETFVRLYAKGQEAIQELRRIRKQTCATCANWEGPRDADGRWNCNQENRLVDLIGASGYDYASMSTHRSFSCSGWTVITFVPPEGQK